MRGEPAACRTSRSTTRGASAIPAGSTACDGGQVVHGVLLPVHREEDLHPAGMSIHRAATCWVSREAGRGREEDGLMAFSEYKPGSAFPGVIGRTTDESTPAWPQPLRATPGAPNVVMIVLDDTGF